MKFPLTGNRLKWPHVVATVALSALGVLCTCEAWVDIWRIAWQDPESSQILLVPVVAAWLVWVRRARLVHYQPLPSFLGPLVIAMGWAAWWFGCQYGRQSPFHGGAVLVLIGCVVTVLGRRIFADLLPAFAVLVFLVPVPGLIRQQIAIPLQTATAQVTEAVFHLVGVPVDRAGNQLIYNGLPVAIAEACNGLRMVFALVLVSYAFAFGSPLRSYVRMLILAASPLSAILCNVLRIVPTVLIFGYADREFAMKFHDASGWVMLAVAFLLLMGIIEILRWAMVPVTRYTLARD